ncbi:hypothetical protein BDK61_2697 [Haloarcula quadrata]|uniref:Uncharacterized protein n=1 Tax=Haloarcula quadrata TaxID=182779 RepID=A0A495R917_9EURY|nr:hypothetical protein BDK61_2697 [Haloarcula quadrata]
MYQNGHYGAALLFVAPTGALLIAAGFVELALMAGATAVALAMVPDLDQRVPGITHQGPLTRLVWAGCWSPARSGRDARDGRTPSGMGCDRVRRRVCDYRVAYHRRRIDRISPQYCTCTTKSGSAVS